MAKESSSNDSIKLTFVGLAEALFPVNNQTASWKYPSDKLSEIHVSIPISTCLHTFVQNYWDNIGHREESSTPPFALFVKGVRLAENATPASERMFNKTKVVVLLEVSYTF